MLNNVLQKNTQPCLNVVRTEGAQKRYDEIKATAKKCQDILKKRAEAKAKENDTPDVDTNPIIMETPKTRKYDNYKLIPDIQKCALVDGTDSYEIERSSIQSGIFDSKDGMANFNTLLQRMNDDIFIESLRRSLLFSYQYKKNIYIRKYNDAKVILDTESTRSTKTFLSLIDLLNTKIEEFAEPGTEIIVKIRMQLEEAINDPINGLNSLIGRDDIKNILASQVLAFSNNPMTFLTRINNFALYGQSGVGKTKLGQTLAFFYSKCGILARDLFIVTTAGKMVHSYVSATARMVNQLLESVLDGVLFIDEAYSISGSAEARNLGRANHGTEAIDEMVGFIDKNVGLSLIIIAGYQDKMENDFMTSNEGLSRRFPNVIVLEAYTSSQLTDLLLKFIAQSHGPIFGDMEANIVYSYIDTLSEKDNTVFDKQAGDILILAGDMLEAIYGSLYTWVDADYNNNHHIIIKGINLYLSRRNKKLLYV